MNEYKELRNSLTNKIKQAKADYFKQELTDCGGDKNKVWKFIRRITDKGTKVAIPETLTAAVFNDYYISVPLETVSLLSNRDQDILWKGPITDKRFSFCDIQEQHVKEALAKLGSKSDMDILGFDSKLLCIAVDVISSVITKMFNVSVIHSVIPDDWKTARVTPVYKNKGDKYDTCNYRPISIIAHLSKMFETQVHKQLLSYMNDNHFINIDQSAYLKFCGTHTALHRVTEDFIDNVCHNIYTGVCALDIKKCFDTIDHRVLLAKLSYYGVTGSALDWFRAYLKDRSQVVRAHGDVSSKGILSMGVPQGSVLGPLLFLVFVNDISQHIFTGTANLYADDTLIYCDGDTPKEVNDKLQKCIDEVSKWYASNNLVINTNKSNTMLVTSNYNAKNHDNQLCISLNGNKLQDVKDLTYLGVVIDNTLSWDTHVRKVCKTVSFIVSRLARLSNSLPKEVLLQIYNASIQPQIDYALTVWGITTDQNLHKVQRLQNYAARVITNNFDYVNVRGIELVHQLGWMDVKQRIKYFELLLMFKCIHGMAPSHLCNNVILECEVSERITRSHCMDLYLPFPATEFSKRLFFYRGAKAWNSLSDAIKECHSLPVFKDSIKRFVKLNL